MDDLIATTLHDAKNRLNALLVWIDQAEKSGSVATLPLARQQAISINAQLVELLALYRQGRGALRLNIADQDLLNYWEDLQCEWVSPPDAPPILWPQDTPVPAWAFDGYQVKLILFDALRNAQRHAQSRIDLSVTRDDEGLHLTVADDGPGFPVSQEPKAMDAEGSGLGLVFARLIADHHRTPDGRCGRVEMKNAPTGGALFSLILP